MVVYEIIKNLAVDTMETEELKKPNNLHVDLEKSRSVGFVMQARITCVCMIGGEGGGIFAFQFHFSPFSYYRKKNDLQMKYMYINLRVDLQ